MINLEMHMHNNELLKKYRTGRSHINPAALECCSQRLSLPIKEVY
jgi:hypothetical protein